MSVERRSGRNREISGEARERVIFALEVGSNDPNASEDLRATAERLLHLQRQLARHGHS